MMKHVQLSPYRNRADTVSLSSNASFASLSPEPFTSFTTATSRSSSYTSLNEQHHNNNNNNNNNKTTCREVVDTLLSKYRMKHRDPRLFYLSMEVMVRKGPLRTHIALDDAAKPALLQSCHPRGDSRFSLQTRRGGLVKVYDSLLNSHSQYKSLLISTQTTTNELITLLLTCYTNTTNTTTIQLNHQVKQFSLYEVWPAREQQRKLHPDDKPLLVQQTWPNATACHFLIKTNPDYRPLTRRKFPLTSSTKPQCEFNHFHLSEQQQQQHYSNNNNNNSSIKSIALFEEKRKREQQEKTKLQQKQEQEEQIKNYNSKYNDFNQSYADYENYFYI